MFLKLFHFSAAAKVVVNFRKVIGNFMMKFSAGVQACVANINVYLESVQRVYSRLFLSYEDGSSPTPINRKNFYLDNSLPFEKVDIGRGIYEKYIFPKVGPSRILSLSMFIHPIFLLRSRLYYQQLLELCFVACLHNNPLWFNKVMMSLIEKDKSDNNHFFFSPHPFYDWMNETEDIFNENANSCEDPRSLKWQTSLYKRFSPTGGTSDIREIFGAYRDSSMSEKLAGTEKLEKIVDVLYWYTQWVDNFEGLGNDPINEMPISSLQSDMKNFCIEINEVAPCQIGLFRLSIFTTLVTGAGLLKQGVHLRQLMIPSPNNASLHHLKNPSGGQMSKEKSFSLANLTNFNTSARNDGNDCILDEDLDRAMQLISTALGIPKYFRDVIECLLVCLNLFSLFVFQFIGIIILTLTTI